MVNARLLVLANTIQSAANVEQLSIFILFRTQLNSELARRRRCPPAAVPLGSRTQPIWVVLMC